jgi:ribosomal protein S18 acetylase RimI-like enzyme
MNEITINDKTFLIDIERAKSLGLITEKRKQIVHFEDGDLFAGEHLSVVVMRRSYKSDFWDIVAAEYRGLEHFSDFGVDREHSEGLTFDEMLDFLNNRELSFVKNINYDIKNLVKEILADSDFR